MSRDPNEGFAYPSVSYDYAAANVGAPNTVDARAIAFDASEHERVIAYVSANKKERE